MYPELSDLTVINKWYLFVIMFVGFLVMSLVEDSHAGGTECHPNGGSGHCGDIGKDARIRDITFQDAINFLEKVQDQW